MNIVDLPGSESSLKLRASTRRIGLCWEATRAPRWTRIPQAWAAQAARAGLLRDRQQSEKSQGFGDGVPESFPDQTKTRTRGKSALAFSANRRFTLNQYIPGIADLEIRDTADLEVGATEGRCVGAPVYEPAQIELRVGADCFYGWAANG